MSGPRLSAIETAYVELAAQGSPVQIGSVGIFDGALLLDEDGRFRLEEVRARVASRLHLLPRLRQRIVPAPLGLGRPAWVDAEDFDISDHVEVQSLCQPADERALLELAADLQVRALDPLRPPWHLCFVTGLPDGRVALIERASHALIDGVSGVDLAVVLLDLDPEVPLLDVPSWSAAPTPSLVGSAASAVRDQLEVPTRIAAATLRALRSPSRLPQRGTDIWRSIDALVGGGLRAPRSSLNHPVGPRRRLDVVRQDVAALKEAGRGAGATLNEVVLAAVTTGLRRMLLARGDALDSDLELRALVPVSQRGVDERGALGNRVSALLVPLPVGLGDPAERLRSIIDASVRLKGSEEAKANAALLDLAEALPAPLVGAAVRLLDHQPLVNVVVTNVPGPDVPLYALGAPLLEAIPMVPLAGNLTLGVAVLSYCGALTLGITSDPTTCRDVGTFVDGVAHGFTELLAARELVAR